MPCALLFGCDKELVQRLASDPRWKVSVAVHCEEGRASYSLPSPSVWDLIVDDCLHPPVRNRVDPAKGDAIPGNIEPTEEDIKSLGLVSYRIPNSYLREAVKAHGIRFCTNEDEFHEVETMGHRRERHMPMEFNDADPRALHVATLVQSFESSFRPGFLYNRNRGSAGTALFQDFYDHTTVAISEERAGADWLYLVDIRDKKKRVDALWQLCVRVAPKLWPSLYAGSFQSRRIHALREHQSQLSTKFRAEMQRIDDEVEREEKFFGPFYNVLYTGDEALVDLVATAFQDIFHCVADNLDEQVTKDDWRTLDLKITCGEWSAFAEIKGSTNRNARIDDLQHLDDHYEVTSGRFGRAQSKILVFNGKYGRPEAERLRDATFSSQVREEAETRGITLVDTRDLLDAIDRIRNGDLSEQEFIQCLAKPGRLTLPPET